MTGTKWKRRVAGWMAALMLGAVGIGSAFAAGVASELPPKEVMIWNIAQKVLQKGDEAVLALARLAKVRLFLEKTKQPEKALAELNTLEQEVQDQEVRVVVTVLKLMVMEKSQAPVEQQLEVLDGMIASARGRLGR